MPCVFGIIWLAVVVLIIVGMWKVFQKAGRPGWESIVPFYNLYVLTVEIAKMEIVWFILMLIFPISIYAGIKVGMVIAPKFGKEANFGIGLGLLPMIFYPILGFGAATFQGGAAPAGAQPPAAPPAAE